MDLFAILFILGVFIILIIIKYLPKMTHSRKNLPQMNAVGRITNSINHPSSEILELIGEDDFNSLLLNDKGVFVIMEKVKK